MEAGPALPGALTPDGWDSVGGFTSFTASTTSCDVLDSGWWAVASGQHCCLTTVAPLRCSGVENRCFGGAASTAASGLRRAAEHDRNWQTAFVSMPMRADSAIVPNALIELPDAFDHIWCPNDSKAQRTVQRLEWRRQIG